MYILYCIWHVSFIFSTFLGCCFVTFFTRKAALNAQDALHNVKTLAGVSVNIGMFYFYLYIALFIIPRSCLLCLLYLRTKSLYSCCKLRWILYFYFRFIIALISSNLSRLRESAINFNKSRQDRWKSWYTTHTKGVQDESNSRLVFSWNTREYDTFANAWIICCNTDL